MHACPTCMLALVLLMAVTPARRATGAKTNTGSATTSTAVTLRTGTNGCPINTYDYCNYTSSNKTMRCPSCSGCKTIDGFGENVQACRLPYKLNGIILDADICPNSMQSTPVYANSDSSSERAIGTLVTFRTGAGWLVATVRLDCPWLMWFSYNGKMPPSAEAAVHVSQNSNGSITRRSQRRLMASSATTTTTCPSLTTTGAVLYGNGNGQYQNGRPDARSTLSLTYTGSKGIVVEQIPMYRYQNDGDGSNNKEDNGGDGWYSCYTFMHQMKNIATTCEKVSKSLLSLTLPLVYKVVSDGSQCSVASADTTVKTGSDKPSNCTSQSNSTSSNASPPPSSPSPTPSPPSPPAAPLPPTNQTDGDGKGKCYPQLDQQGEFVKWMCIYIEIPPDSAVTLDENGQIQTTSGLNNTETIAKEEHKDGSLKEPPPTSEPTSSPSPSPSPSPAVSPSPSTPPSSSPPPILSPLDVRSKDKPIILVDTGDDDDVRNFENPPTLPTASGTSYGVDSPALEGPGSYTHKISDGSDTALGSDEGLMEGGSAEDVPIENIQDQANGGINTIDPSPAADASPSPSPSPVPSPSPSDQAPPSLCTCPPHADASGLCNNSYIPLTWRSRQSNAIIVTQCIDPPYIHPNTDALVLPICFRRSCFAPDGSLDDADLDLEAAHVALPAAFQQSSVGVALTLLRPACVSEAWAEGFPVQADKYNSLLFNEADTVATPGGGLSSFSASLRLGPQCDDRSAVFMLNVMSVAITETVYNMCPRHAIPDTSNGNTDCPFGKVMVFLDITDGDWNKDTRFSTVKQCVDPANYDMFGGEMAISYCWSFGQLPDPFAIRPFRVRMPNVTYYNIQRMPGGSWDTRVNKPIDRGVTVSLTVNPVSESRISINQTGLYSLPSTGIYSVDMEILVPVGLDDQSVSVQMFGPPNPPPPTELCPCPEPLPANGICPGTTALMTASLVANPNVTQYGCVPSPYWDGLKGELMFSHCWRYLCLDSRFQKQDYFLDLDFTDKYNVADVPAGQHRLDWFKPKVVDMFLKFRFNDQKNPEDYAEFSSRGGQSQNITIPPGGVRQMGVRFKIPYNMIYDTNSGSVNLNTDVSRLIPPPPPPLAITNYSYTVNRTGSILKSLIYVSDVNVSKLNLGAMTNFSSDIQGQLESYMMTSDVTFPDFGLLKSCTPSDVQKILDKVASNYGVSPGSLSASCQYNYVKPSSIATATRHRRGRGVLETTSSGTVICKPRISLTIAMPLSTPLDGNADTTLAAATTAANAVYTAVGDEACYVPTGAESAVGTMVSFTSNNPRANCEYLLQAFASSSSLSTNSVRTVDCGSYEPTKPYPMGMIVLWSVVGAVCLVLLILGAAMGMSLHRRRSQNLLLISANGKDALSVPPNGRSPAQSPRASPNKVCPTEVVFTKRALGEGYLDRPDTPAKYMIASSAGGAVPPVAVNGARINAWIDPGV